ncbi:MAG: hypothetical protein ACOYKJ_04780 [Candidatus Howiella sp.]|jgi:hypothetical protein
MKNSVETLKAVGFKGYQRNSITGNTIEANYPLDEIAWAMNNAPHRIRTTRDDIGKKIRIHIDNENWTPPKAHEIFAERPMTPEECKEAEERLEKMGVTVSGGGNG